MLRTVVVVVLCVAICCYRYNILPSSELRASRDWFDWFEKDFSGGQTTTEPDITRTSIWRMINWLFPTITTHEAKARKKWSHLSIGSHTRHCQQAKEKDVHPKFHGGKYSKKQKLDKQARIKNKQSKRMDWKFYEGTGRKKYCGKQNDIAFSLSVCGLAYQRCDDSTRLSATHQHTPVLFSDTRMLRTKSAVKSNGNMVDPPTRSGSWQLANFVDGRYKTWARSPSIG